MILQKCAGIGKILYKKDTGPDEVLVFRHYNATEV